MILDAIARLAEQVEEFRNEMNERLDVVDDKLDRILFHTSANFRSIKRDLRSLEYVSKHTLQQVRTVAEEVRFNTQVQLLLFREHFRLKHTEAERDCYGFRDDLPAVGIDVKQFANCLNGFKSAALTVPTLLGFDESADVPFDEYANNWGYSPRNAPLQRLHAELNYLFRAAGGRVAGGQNSAPTYKGFDATTFFAILPSYFATVRAWPDYRSLLEPIAFDEFIRTIEEIEETRRRVSGGGDHWSLSQLARRYVQRIRALDVELYDVALAVSGRTLRGYRDHRYQLF